MNLQNLKKNDILVSMYSYNMTLYTFYKVLEVKNKTIKLYPLSHTNKWHGYMQNEVKPIDTNACLISKVITKRLNKYNEIKFDNCMPCTLYNKDYIYDENHAD